MKVSDLQGAALDWAVAKCEGRGLHRSKSGRWMTANYGGFNPRHGAPWYEPSTNWAQGGPIIEREYIQLTIDLAWVATLTCEDKKFGGVECFEGHGPTPLIAAMRCYVASKLSNDIEVPKELI